MDNGENMLSGNYRNYRRFFDKRGWLGVVEDYEIPFDIKRVFWITGVPEGEERGHHSHEDCYQFIFCLSGSFNVLLDDVSHKVTSENTYSLYVPPNTNIILKDFSSDAVCLVLASHNYDPKDAK